MSYTYIIVHNIPVASFSNNKMLSLIIIKKYMYNHIVADNKKYVYDKHL